MATFYVGQRVRIVGAGASLFLIGTEARIVRWSDRAFCRQREEVYSGWILDVQAVDGAPFCARPEWIEPIVDDGRKVIEWSECLWQPEGIAA